jgi:hypothetical protein
MWECDQKKLTQQYHFIEFTEGRLVDAMSQPHTWAIKIGHVATQFDFRIVFFIYYQRLHGLKCEPGSQGG